MHSIIVIWHTKIDEAMQPNIRINKQITLGTIRIIPMCCKLLSLQTFSVSESLYKSSPTSNKSCFRAPDMTSWIFYQGYYMFLYTIVENKEPTCFNTFQSFRFYYKCLIQTLYGFRNVNTSSTNFLTGLINGLFGISPNVAGKSGKHSLLVSFWTVYMSSS